MSYKLIINCLYCILIAGFMLNYQPAFSQEKFVKVGNWVDENLQHLGGNAVMLIYNNGKIVYEYAASNQNNAAQKGKEKD